MYAKGFVEGHSQVLQAPFILNTVHGTVLINNQEDLVNPLIVCVAVITLI